MNFSTASNVDKRLNPTNGNYFVWALCVKLWNDTRNFQIWHVNEYPKIHYLGIPRGTQSMIAYQDFDWVFLEIPVKNCIVGMLLTCPIVMWNNWKSSSQTIRTFTFRKNQTIKIWLELFQNHSCLHKSWNKLSPLLFSRVISYKMLCQLRSSQ